jgi:hypothetical protein
MTAIMMGFTSGTTFQVPYGIPSFQARSKKKSIDFRYFLVTRQMFRQIWFSGQDCARIQWGIRHLLCHHH